MKQNKSLCLAASFVLAPVALSYFFVAGFAFFSSSGSKWSRISELFVWGLSEPAFIGVAVIPPILAIILLVGMVFNIKIARNLQKVNTLFLVLLVIVSIPIFFENVFAMWAAVSVSIAWLLQRHTTKTWLKKNS